jgi:hypothetical protein
MLGSPPCRRATHLRPGRSGRTGHDREDIVELLVRHPGLDHAIKVLGIDRDYALHVAQIDAHPAERRVDVALERGAGAIGDDRDPVAGADLHDRSTSCVDWAKTMASGGSLSIQVMVLACCSRTAREVTTRFPNRAVSAATAAEVACGSRTACALSCMASDTGRFSRLGCGRDAAADAQGP